MHQYYTGFELLQPDSIAEFLPEDDVPNGLNIQPFDDSSPDERRIARAEFKDWLQEGKSD